MTEIKQYFNLMRKIFAAALEDNKVKFKFIKDGVSDRGLGGVIETHSIFGIKQWVLLPSQDGLEDETVFDKWVCKNNGHFKFAVSWSGDLFYRANRGTESAIKSAAVIRSGEQP